LQTLSETVLSQEVFLFSFEVTGLCFLTGLVEVMIVPIVLQSGCKCCT